MHYLQQNQAPRGTQGRRTSPRGNPSARCHRPLVQAQAGGSDRAKLQRPTGVNQHQIKQSTVSTSVLFHFWEKARTLTNDFHSGGSPLGSHTGHKPASWWLCVTQNPGLSVDPLLHNFRGRNLGYVLKKLLSSLFLTSPQRGKISTKNKAIQKKESEKKKKERK